MKKNYLLFMAVLLLFQVGLAQTYVTNQVIIGSGGNFNDPDDHVRLSSFKDGEDLPLDFGNVFTQSIQDVAIAGHFAYVAAQDSLAKFNIDTYERVAVTSAPGVHNITVAGDQLVVTFWYPVTEGFVKIYDADDLSLLATIEDISGDAAGCVVINQTAYVAVPGAWGTELGKIAKINLTAQLLIEEIDLGEVGVNINDLYLQTGADHMIVAVCPTPWGGSSGNLLLLNPDNDQVQSYTFDVWFGNGVALHNNLLYNMIGNGIGSIDLSLMQIADTTIFDSPAFGFVGAALDTINDLFYVSTTDYITSGAAYVYNMSGDQLESFATHIDANSIVMDYRSTEGLEMLHENDALVLYPNPASDLIHIRQTSNQAFSRLQLIDTHGTLLLDESLPQGFDELSLSVFHLHNGVYFIRLSGPRSVVTSRFIKF